MKPSPQSLAFVYRFASSPLRTLPDFIILGAQKCGTSSLYGCLSQHPQVVPVHEKELHFFDLNFHRGVEWYRAQFPLRIHRRYEQIVHQQSLVSGEASPYYLFHPHVPRRIAAIAPDIKLVILLRNPVDRAYSHYHHNVRKRRESLSFAEAIQQEGNRIQGEHDRILNDDRYISTAHQHFSYLARGVYVDQIRAFEKFFPKEQILIVRSEQLFEATNTAYREVLDFLNLPLWFPKNFKPRNVNSYTQIEPAIRRQLQTYFEPHNQRLYAHLGIDFGW
ncbi:MAG: sulfotransferase domain-containing protein [Elainellaceae cyanobacterium]